MMKSVRLIEIFRLVVLDLFSGDYSEREDFLNESCDQDVRLLLVAVVVVEMKDLVLAQAASFESARQPDVYTDDQL